MGENGNGAGNTGVKTGAGRFNLGPDPRRGHGVKGRSGRKPDNFIAECERLTDEVVLQKVARKLSRGGPDDAAWRWSAEYVSKYVKSEAPRHVALTDGDGAPARFTFVINSPVGDSDN